MSLKLASLIIGLIGLLCVSAPSVAILHAQETTVKASASQLEALTKADDARVAAMKMPSKEKLAAIFSDELHYTHSNGNLDTKQSFIEVLTAGKTKYVAYDYEKREFHLAAPNIALMTGRAHVQARTGEATMDSVLSFLAVWRLEKGEWKFLAWQSCRVPPPAAK